MKTWVWRVILASSFCISFVPSAFATDIQTTSKVAAVTVYADRAAVTRSGTAHVPAGAHVVMVTNMPAGFDENSLRVQGKALSPVKIGSIEVKRVFLAELAAAAEQEKAKALQAKRDERAMIDAELKALQTRASFIEKLASDGSKPQSQSGGMTVITTEKQAELSPDKWSQAWGMLQTGMTETQKNIVAKEIARRTLDEEITKLDREYQQIRTSKRERRDVAIHIEAKDDTDFDFTMMYQAYGPSWQPLYDARLNTEKGEMKLEQYGQVMQQTGEDWKDIELTFSTARPELGTEMPQMSVWYVQNYAQIQKQNVKMEASRVRGSHAFAEKTILDSASGGMSPEDFSQEDPMKPAIPLMAMTTSAQVQETDYSAEFRVPGRVDLKSVSEPAKFFVGDQMMKAELSVRTTPRLTTQAYLFAKLTNAEKYPVIPGQVAKYRDGAFMGNATTKMLRPGESFALSFGIDDRVKVTYQKTKQEQTNPALGLIGDITAERHYKTTVKNLHKTPINITVIDQYPVSRNPDVKIKLLDEVTTAGYIKDPEDRQNVIQWIADYQPQEEKTYNIGFMVKYPKDQHITGF